MKKNTGILALLALVIVVVAISGCANNATNNNTNNNSVNEKSTKLSLTNNGATWVQIELVGNTTKKDGSPITIYAEAFIKPNSTATIDLSQLLGYGNEKLPAGTQIRFQSWKGLFNPAAGGDGALDLTFQGWSNTLKPGADDKTTDVKFSPIPIYQLPANINDTAVFLATTPEELAKIAPYDTAEQEPVYEEEILTVDENGRVTITITRPPELCRAIASIV